MSSTRCFRTSLMLCLVLSALQQGAQSHLIGARFGFSRTNTVFRKLVGEEKSGLSGGVTYEFRLNRYFLLGTGTIFNQRGFANTILLTDEQGNHLSETRLLTKFDYLSFPLHGGLTLGKKFVGFLNLGLEPSLLLSARSSIFMTNQSGVRSGNSMRAGFTDLVVDLCAFTDIGFGYRMKERYWLYAAAGFQNSLYAYTDSQFFLYSLARHVGYTLSAGIKIELHRQNPTP